MKSSRGLKSIKNFEDFGKRVDEELDRVKSFVKEEVAPGNEKRTAQFLREVSESSPRPRPRLKHVTLRATQAQPPENPPNFMKQAAL